MLVSTIVLMASAWWVLRWVSPLETTYRFVPVRGDSKINLYSVKNVVALILSLGFRLASATMFIVYKDFFLETFARWAPLPIGFASTLALWCYSLFPGYADGRILWRLTRSQSQSRCWSGVFRERRKMGNVRLLWKKEMA